MAVYGDGTVWSLLPSQRKATELKGLFRPLMQIYSASDLLAKAEKLLEKLLIWLDRNGLSSYDFADALRSPLLLSLTLRSRFAQRLAIQTVKNCPVNIRPILGITPHVSSQTLALMCSARAWQNHGGQSDVPLKMVKGAAIDLINDRLGSFSWGLKLYYTTRFVRSTPSTPNLFQTGTAAHALLDAYQVAGDQAFAEAAQKAVDFCFTELGIVDSSAGRYCRYYPGFEAAVYNVNALLAAACTRLACLKVGDSEMSRKRSEDLLTFVLKGQRKDGSWPYAADSNAQWTDGFHTGYILEALGYLLQSPLDKQVRGPLKIGVEFFEQHLIDHDGCPKYYPDSRYPVDIQNCAQALQTTARLLPLFDSDIDLLGRMIDCVVRQLFVDDCGEAGYFAASRTRWFKNKTPYVRWGQSPMVLALTHVRNALKQIPAYYDLYKVRHAVNRQ